VRVRVGLVGSEEFPVAHWRDVDSEPVAGELRELGAEVELIAWDSPRPVDWAGFGTLVLQSPWSMWRRLADFHAWLDARVADGTRLLNPVDVLRLGSSKRYLGDLAAAGVVTVPTTIVEDVDGLPERIAAAFEAAREPRRTVLVKPISSGGALGIREYPADQADQAAGYLRRLVETEAAALVQPYVNAIDQHRELAVILMGGRITHAITKAPILRPGDEHRDFHPDPRPYDLSAAQTTLVQRAYQAFLGLRPAGAPPVLSVRMDFLIDPGSDPELLLLEVECVAPVKFFPLFPGLARDYARLILEPAA
jgi:hypothetical protein